MDDAARQALRRQRRAKHRAAIVEHLDQIVFANAARLGVLDIHAHDPVIITIDVDAMVLDVEQKRILAVALGVEGKFRMRRQQLQRIALEQFAGMAALP
jgi:hypothetical protein